MLQFVPETSHDLHDGDFGADRWELYHLDDDFSECEDRAQSEPDKLAGIVDLWWSEAQRNQVLPLSEQLSPAEKPEGSFEPRAEYVYHGPLQLPEAASPVLHDRAHTIVAVLDVPPEGARGVILSSGGPEGGFVLLVSGRRAHYVTNLLGRTIGVASSEQNLAAGRVTVRADVAVPVPGRALVTLAVDGVRGPPVELSAANPVSYDVRGRGLQIGSGLAGVWPAYMGPLEFDGDIVEVRISYHGEKRPDAQAQARVAFIEQ
jgi:arylsulfatase